MAWRLASSKTMFLVYVVQKPAQFFFLSKLFHVAAPYMTTIFSYTVLDKKSILDFSIFEKTIQLS